MKQYEDGAVIVHLYSGQLETGVFVAAPKSNTAYFKKSLDDVKVNENGIIGDQHGKYHGGAERAINHFPQEDYEQLRDAFPDYAESLRADSKSNGFGENISTTGGNMNLHTVCIGDQFRVGDCLLEVNHARYPCNKVNLRHNTAKGVNIKQYSLDHGLNGWFYKVLEGSELKVGDTFKRVAHPHPEWPIFRVQKLLYITPKETSPKELQEMLELEELCYMPWKRDAEKMLSK